MTPEQAQQLRGRILAAWREHRGLKQDALAARLRSQAAQVADDRAAGYTGKAVAHWEAGRSAMPASVVRTTAALFGAGPALPDLLRAAGRPLALPARARWRHNFPDRGAPAWAWLRLRQVDEPAWAHLRWGAPFRGDVLLEPEPGGLLVTFFTSIPNPPLEVTLPSPGWVAFGHGEVPSAVTDRLGVRQVDAREVHSEAAVESSIDPAIARRLLTVAARVGLRSFVEQTRLRWTLIEPHLGVLHPHEQTLALDALDLEAALSAHPPEFDQHGRLLTQFLLTGDVLAQLRDACGLSLTDAADLVTAMLPAHPLTRKQLWGLENGSRPRVQLLLSRLDRLYDADGRVGIDGATHLQPTRDGQAVRVRFPDFWCGPIWLQPHAPRPGDQGPVVLTWGPWRRTVEVPAGAVLTTNKATSSRAPTTLTAGAGSSWVLEAPLQIALPAGWLVSVGTGAVSTAGDVNHGWSPTSPTAALQLLGEGVAAARNALALRRGTGARSGLAKQRPSPQD